MIENKQRIADLYYYSNTVAFGSFSLSIHRDFPDLPKSPWYMHYPRSGEPGSEYLPELYSAIGEEFYNLSQNREPVIKPNRIAGLPNGALPIADTFAGHFPEYPQNLLHFAKIEYPDGRIEFPGPEEAFEAGEVLDTVEDHISGGRNNLLFVERVRELGFIVSRLFVVVDRQQGGPANLAAKGVEVIPILTGDEILQHGVNEGHIKQTLYEEVQTYRQTNQFSLAGLKSKTSVI